jgi:hypothetical protein
VRHKKKHTFPIFDSLWGLSSCAVVHGEVLIGAGEEAPAHIPFGAASLPTLTGLARTVSKSSDRNLAINSVTPSTQNREHQTASCAQGIRQQRNLILSSKPLKHPTNPPHAPHSTNPLRTAAGELAEQERVSSAVGRLTCEGSPAPRREETESTLAATGRERKEGEV